MSSLPRCSPVRTPGMNCDLYPELVISTPSPSDALCLPTTRNLEKPLTWPQVNQLVGVPLLSWSGFPEECCSASLSQPLPSYTLPLPSLPSPGGHDQLMCHFALAIAGFDCTAPSFLHVCLTWVADPVSTIKSSLPSFPLVSPFGPYSPPHQARVLSRIFPW